MRTTLAVIMTVLGLCLMGCRARTVVLPAETVTVEREVHSVRVDTVTVEVPAQVDDYRRKSGGNRGFGHPDGTEPRRNRGTQ